MNMSWGEHGRGGESGEHCPVWIQTCTNLANASLTNRILLYMSMPCGWWVWCEGVQTAGQEEAGWVGIGCSKGCLTKAFPKRHIAVGAVAVHVSPKHTSIPPPPPTHHHHHHHTHIPLARPPFLNVNRTERGWGASACKGLLDISSKHVQANAPHHCCPSPFAPPPPHTHSQHPQRPPSLF